MKSLWRLVSLTKPDEPVSYQGTVRVHSQTTLGVAFTIQRISFGRRMDLSRRVREISQRVEFFAAGSELQEKIEASMLSQEIDAMYLRWGLDGIEGLLIDGVAATVEGLIEKGPDELAREIVGSIKQQCGLTDTERKN